MKTVELKDETHAAPQRLAAAKNLTPDQLLTLTDPTDRCLALLGWCARRHAGDFADSISHPYRSLL